ncbi:hypothetical protein PoB_000527600 [Plakobranchus ocellatus]|uniref:Uncharacterized protein n=1 Tax=Plakobranchus ocellatus TaxID=259542 RepID=A0AAV3XUT3_9GAST|nr:hypothetical protein PoB_000527600 [Plakobranchus ocellatus]
MRSHNFLKKTILQACCLQLPETPHMSNSNSISRTPEYSKLSNARGILIMIINYKMKNTPDTLDRKENRSLVKTIRKRQAIFLGHVMRRGKLEHLVTARKFEGKRSRRRQGEKIMDGLATWLGTGKVLDTLAAVKDRDLWRDMIANAYKQGT